MCSTLAYVKVGKKEGNSDKQYHEHTCICIYVYVYDFVYMYMYMENMCITH